MQAVGRQEHRVPAFTISDDQRFGTGREDAGVLCQECGRVGAEDVLGR